MLKDRRTDQAEALLMLLRRVMREVAPADEDDPLAGLSIGQIRIVNSLWQGPKTSGELAAELGMSASALTQMVNRLIDSGLIAKFGDDADKRYRRLSLTDSGKLQYSARHRVRLERSSSLLAALPDRDRTRLLDLLAKMTQDQTASINALVTGLERGYNI